ncbi:hypothetical protein Mhar_2245 [Methanothrix harundinacea 6Ac]|uniref:Uncharacterized protein n=1 Tax=Methanothrix harundinacea (strain 6Ac) TaxID=1110509 RepID=G7WRD4_METH6|nr:hypothetical protein Mhar_2245 [Methanothrix harundinacea 6Ac]
MGHGLVIRGGNLDRLQSGTGLEEPEYIGVGGSEGQVYNLLVSVQLVDLLLRTHDSDLHHGITSAITGCCSSHLSLFNSNIYARKKQKRAPLRRQVRAPPNLWPDMKMTAHLD